ncbi:serine/threonine-protein phosphatase 1 regulatory subunit 10 [Drosophila teissieri]|uniref:serine/threonine-protein phosphatase 1 regulatory subunit 10 n=1 Tax=Drosophila teissieri TaxID=7243 RepID=UPI001CBA1D81|nr:serine/threonine-protein phosphatase 1 regulatory subunit 10 [Drosophila teissieri]XP_043649439.1 serine/threonine-protein phosphatase 1 regulatory subunit 10 [Drosophila teissieri]
MPRIVPLQLLRCLRVLLDNNGGILSAVEVKRISGLMAKYSKKLVSKCVYVQILKSTKTELLGDFMAVGGWSLVYTWLNDAIRAMNWPLVQEILELLLLSPVDVNRLKINSAPILVKGLCKDGGNEGVRILAKRLVEQWLKIVTENTSMTIQGAAPQIAATTASQVPTSVSGAGSAPVPDSASSSDSTDSAGAPVTYTITSAANSSNSNSITIKWKPLLDNPDGGDEADSGTAPKGSEEEHLEKGSSATHSLADASLGKKSGLDDSSSAAEVKSGEDVDNKKHKSSKSDKSKRSEKEREKDRKKESSTSHRSSSSSHKSSSSSSSSSSKSSSSKSSSSSSSSHRSSSDKHRDKDKPRSSSGSSSSSKDRERSSGSSSSSSNKHKSSKSSSSSSSSSSSGSSSSKDRKSSSSTSSSSSSSRQDKDKDNKLMPPPAVAAASAAGSSPTASAKESDAQKPRSIPIMSRKASISIEIRRDTEKTGTVKTYQSKFRSHGLTEEAPPPPSRKGLKKPTSSAVAASPALMTVPPSLKRPSPPPRDAASDKKAKIDINNVAGHVERPGAAKLIAPKKIQTLVETNLFSDALAASIEPKKVVKRKRTSATSPTDKDAPLAPLKFYQDTLDESKSEEKSDDSSKENDDARSASPGKDTDADDDDIPLKRVKEDIEQKVQKEKAAAGEGGEAGNTSDNAEDLPEEPKKPGPGCGPDGPPGVLMLHRRKGPKKKLTWQPEEKLTQIRYFEVDRSERVNVMKQTFLEMKNMERFSERDALTIARRGFDDTMEPQMEWRPLIEVDNVPDHPNGNLSKQRQVQMDREATTLRALYFSPDMIPDSAAEAELEPHFAHDIPVIPMDDLTGNPDAVNDYSTLAWPEPKGYAPSSGVGANNSGSDMGFNDNMMAGLGPGPNLMQNPFDPFMGRMPAPTGMPPGPNMMPNQVPNGPPQIWQNQMGPGGVPPGVPPMMNGPGGPGMDMGNMNNMNQMPPQNFMGNQFGSPVPPFGGGPPPGFNQYPPMMMNGPGPGPVMGPNGPVMGPNGPMMNGPPNGPMMNGPPNGMGPGLMMGGPRNNNNNRNKNNGGGNWRSGGNNFQDNSGGNWRSAGSGSNRGGGGGGGGNTGVCKQFMRGHCNMGKNCKYVHPQKKRL